MKLPFASLVLLLGAALVAQGAARDPNRVVERVLNDLDRSGSVRGGLDGGQRKRFENARKDLIRFQDKWTQGHYDGGRIDSAIRNLDHVLGSGQVRSGDRDRLQRDLQDLREVRARREYNAARRPPRPPRVRPRPW